MADVSRRGAGDVRALLTDFLRVYDPLADVDALLASLPPDRDAALAAVEARYAAPGHFATVEWNVRSAFFNPLKALYEEGLLPPVPEVLPLDNIHKAQVLVQPYSAALRASTGGGSDAAAATAGAGAAGSSGDGS